MFIRATRNVMGLSAAVTEMVHLEQTSPLHRAASRESDDTGDATPSQVKAYMEQWCHVEANGSYTEEM